MAHPKRQHSRQRQRKRRTHYKAMTPQLQPCPSCGQSKISHRICLYCGHYKGVPVVQVKEVASTEETN